MFGGSFEYQKCLGVFSVGFLLYEQRIRGGRSRECGFFDSVRIKVFNWPHHLTSRTVGGCGGDSDDGIKLNVIFLSDFGFCN